MELIKEKKSEKTNKKPVFILGSPRSGTTIIVTAIKSATNAEGYFEGHFLPLITLLEREIIKYYKEREDLITNKQLMIAHTPKNQLEKKIFNIFSNTYDSLFENKIWFDKTPGVKMIKSAPYLNRIWPNSRFIFAKRRGIECIMSRLRKFPQVSFEEHCKIWQLCMESWLSVRDKVKNSSIEIDQRDISLNPGLIASKIGNFLEIEPEEIEQMEQAFSTKRPEYTGGNELEKALDLTETGWNEEQIAIFQKYCSSVNQKFGYSESCSYYL